MTDNEPQDESAQNQEAPRWDTTLDDPDWKLSPDEIQVANKVFEEYAKDGRDFTEQDLVNTVNREREIDETVLRNAQLFGTTMTKTDRKEVTTMYEMLEKLWEEDDK